MNGIASLPPIEVLRNLFAVHHVDARLDGEWVSLPRGCRAHAVFHQQNDATVQLDVIFEPWLGTAVIESCAGFGESRAAQEAEAWQAFAAGSFHALLAAFLYDEDAPVERTAWEIAGSTRAVTIGPTVNRGEPPHTSEWWAAVRSTVERSALPEGTHWMRFFVARFGDRTITEALLDNEPWESAHAALTDFPWPARDHYYSVRAFLVVQGGVDVGRAVADLVRGGEDDDETIANAMIARGVPPLDADLLVALVPLAFGRALLADRHIDATPDALLTSRAGGEPQRIALEDDPIFAEASWLAPRAALSREQFLRVALRSAEVRLVEEAVQAGIRPEELVFGPLAISIP